MHERTYRLSEGHHELPAEVHIFEHALQLVGELAAALGLQFGDHVLLSVCAGAASQQQPLCQVLLVESLKNILSLSIKSAKVGCVRCVQTSLQSSKHQALLLKLPSGDFECLSLQAEDTYGNSWEYCSPLTCGIPPIPAQSCQGLGAEHLNKKGLYISRRQSLDRINSRTSLDTVQALQFSLCRKPQEDSLSYKQEERFES